MTRKHFAFCAKSYNLDGSWGSDWLEIYPKNKPNINDYPDYEGMDYLYVYLERHYKS